MQSETIYGQVPAKANHYMSVGKEYARRIIKDDVIRNYERSFLMQCRIYKNKMIAFPFRLIVDVFYTSRRYDLDNSIKTILDCLQYARAIKNDNICIGIQATKHIDKRNPRVIFSIQEIQPTLF